MASLADVDARMNWQIVIPYSDGADDARDRALAHTLNRLPDAIWGGFTLGDGAWSKGAAVDMLIRDTDADGLIVHDADVIVSDEALQRSMTAVEAGAAWSQPHGMVYRLSRRGTQLVYEGRLAEGRMPPRACCERHPHYGPHGGGIVVLTRAAYDTSGGIDPRFTVWGGEDEAWARALDTLVGPCVRFDAPMLHLWHPRMPRRPGNRASEANEIIAARYAEAVGDPLAMREARWS
jgi:hypothetical protein